MGVGKNGAGFVDAGAELRYNDFAMEEMIYNVIATQVAAPKKRHIRSEGALYALLVVGALLIIGLGNRLQGLLKLPPVLMQAVLYGLLIAMGYWVLRFRLTSYRYTLTDKALFVTRLMGKTEKLVAEVPLEDIEYAGAYDGAKLKEKGCHMGPNVRTGQLADTTMLIYQENGVRRALCLSADEELKGKLTEPWKN